MRVDNQIISLDPFFVQISANKRKLRVIGIKMDLEQEPKWINGREQFCWIVTVKFLDDYQQIELHFNYNDECVKKDTIRPFVPKIEFPNRIIN
ncbi:hypothetical protein [Gramella sp. MAR_2010_147]|uniref:hypothetical protein n=1 Tax=Gramella sp. MAR_2010_147 TaxID=1250205 RepID=UPI00087D1E8B|nr:hypothetical protein [Gramella sp. MAR_2010_147]SDS63602.1 hypothetical protein SAMN04488553_2723 [Gramella sp. MAR_2010_147]